ncbi:MAG TPA: hypothetical protein VJ599_00855 [Nitrososphaeraceae archaeon]|nr:hypothetical protein [Nitrososphaeraceae archaeon]
MPCMCWYDPSKEDKKIFKMLCQQVVDHIKACNKDGDPIGISVRDAKELISHLYNPDMCTEKKENK